MTLPTSGWHHPILASSVIWTLGPVEEVAYDAADGTVTEETRPIYIRYAPGDPPILVGVLRRDAAESLIRSVTGTAPVEEVPAPDRIPR